MGSATSRLGAVFAISAIASSSILAVAGVAGLPSRETGAAISRLAAPVCEDRVFPYVQAGCGVSLPVQVAVRETAAPAAPARPAEDRPAPISAAASVPAEPAAEPARAVPVPEPVAVAAKADASERAASPGSDVQPEPVALGAKADVPEPAASPPPEPVKIAVRPEPPRALRPHKAYEPISVPRPAEPAEAVERPEGARAVRVIPIDRTHLAAVPGIQAGEPPSSDVAAAAPTAAASPIAPPEPVPSTSSSPPSVPAVEKPIRSASVEERPAPVVSYPDTPRAPGPLTVLVPDEPRESAVDASTRSASVANLADPRVRPALERDRRDEARQRRAEERRLRREEARARYQEARTARWADRSYRARRYGRRWPERQADRSWGGANPPRYRERFVSGDHADRVYLRRRPASGGGLFGWLGGDTN